MDNAPRRRGTTALLNLDFDTAIEDRGLALGHAAAGQQSTEEPVWAGDGCVSNSFADVAWLDAAGPGETGRRGSAIGADGGCIGLWRAVIWQAFLDATAFGNDEIPAWARPKVGESARCGARAWLLSRSENFDQVCQQAQIDPEAVRARARDLERQNWQMPRPGDGLSLDEAI